MGNTSSISGSGSVSHSAHYPQPAANPYMAQPATTYAQPQYANPYEAPNPYLQGGGGGGGGGNPYQAQRPSLAASAPAKEQPEKKSALRALGGGIGKLYNNAKERCFDAVLN